MTRIFSRSVVAPRRSPPLPVFNPRLNVPIRRLNQPPERHSLGSHSRPQRHMTHELAAASQQSGRVRQRRPLKEPHIHVRGEHIHIPERRIAQTRHRTAIMHQLPHLIPAPSHRLKPLPRDRSQLTPMLPHPRIDSGIAFHSPLESDQLRPHRHSIPTFRTIVAATQLDKTSPPQTPPTPSHPPVRSLISPEINT
jgi:hypothetical protein